MVSETGPIAEMANSLSADLLGWFKWERFPLVDQNFPCCKEEVHKPPRKTQAHYHPVDVVFKYQDPYTGKPIYLNTDLKSYESDSITKTMLRDALKSLAQTIDCARVNEHWKKKYNPENEPCEVRGLLFVYNHDGDYDRAFYKLFDPDEKENQRSNSVRLDNIPLQKGQYIHIIEPNLISYLTTIVSDSHQLHHEGTFPKENYYFYYPELTLHKTHGPKQFRAATIESLAAPYLIVEHDHVEKFDEKTRDVKTTFGSGYVVYFNRPGQTPNDFIYLFDTLAGFQLLDKDCALRIRVPANVAHANIRANFEAAKKMYAREWGFDSYKREKLDRVDLGLIAIKQKGFSRTEIAWERE